MNLNNLNLRKHRYTIFLTGLQRFTYARSETMKPLCTIH